MSNPEREFQAAIAAAGLTPPDTIAPGHIYRFPGADKRRGNTAGRCFLFEDMRGGWYQDYSSGGEQVNWQASGSTPYTQAERQANIERSKAANEAYRVEKDQAHAVAAVEAEKRFNAAGNCTQHAYLTTKSAQAYGLKVDGDKLLIPLRDTAGKLQTLQTIAPDGDKRFQKDGEVTGGYHAIGKPSGKLIITEGYATGASTHEATGDAVAVAFNAGNLEPVALALRAKYPALKIIIAADDDYRTDGNPGISAATAAALAVGGFLAVPDFGADRPDGATDFNDLHQITGLAAVKDCIEAATLVIADNAIDTGATGQNDTWPELQPLIVQLDAQEYPLDALPTAVRCAVEEVAGFVKAPIPLIASSALAALSLAIQAHTDVQRAEKLTGPTGLFLLAIADSGERKSTCDGFFTRAIQEYQAREQEAAKPFIKAYKSDMDVWEAQRSGLKEKIKALAKESKPSTVQVQQLHELDSNKPIPPRVPRLIYGDATPEALTYSLAKVWPSGGVISSEAGAVFGGHGMGSESVMRNLAALNQLWDGATLPVERRSSESFTVRGARLTMALQVQEATIRAFFANTKGLARGTGFLARFLVSWPQSTQGMRHFTEAPANWPALANFNGRLTAILNRAAPIDDDGALTPDLLTLAPDAKAAWVQFHNAIESELSTGRELYDVRDVASKTADNAARLAALFHTFAGSIGPIDIEAMESAARVTAWHLTEARRFLGELAMPAELANPARLEAWLLDYCKRDKTDKVPTRAIQQFGPGGLRDKATFLEAIKELAELGRARLVQDGRKRMVQINPALLMAGAA
jgi:putative DNA primase/helicase